MDVQLRIQVEAAGSAVTVVLRTPLHHRA